MIILEETRGGALRWMLPSGHDASGWHATLTAEIVEHLSPAHAALLARPEQGTGGMVWAADGSIARRFTELPKTDRDALTAAAGAILSDIRRLAESGTSPAVQSAWPALRAIPDLSHLFAVDGRPVLAAWGHTLQPGSGDALAEFDDGVPWRQQPPPPWRLYATVLAGLAVLALVAGLLVPVVGWRIALQPAVCTIAPSQQAALSEQSREAARGNELRAMLAALSEEIGRRQLLCPVAQAPPAPAPAPPRAANLPQERWDRHDLSMLDGCWNLATNMTVSDNSGRPPRPLHAWRMCFGPEGSGNQSIVVSEGEHCDGPLQATFDGDVLHVTEPRMCTGPGLNMARSERICHRVNDDEALCDGRHVEGPGLGQTYRGRFHR